MFLMSIQSVPVFKSYFISFIQSERFILMQYVVLPQVPIFSSDQAGHINWKVSLSSVVYVSWCIDCGGNILPHKELIDALTGLLLLH